MSTVPRLAVDPNQPGGSAYAASRTNREYQELWFTVVRKNWKSVVLLPVDEGISAGPIAESIAEVGRRLRDSAVTAIVEAKLDYPLVARLASIALSTSEGGSAPAEVIIAIPAIVTEPLGLAVVQAADATILCVAMQRTRLAAVRRTIELIGRNRIAGCCLIR